MTALPLGGLTPFQGWRGGGAFSLRTRYRAVTPSNDGPFQVSAGQVTDVEGVTKGSRVVGFRACGTGSASLSFFAIYLSGCFCCLRPIPFCVFSLATSVVGCSVLFVATWRRERGIFIGPHAL